MTFNPDWKLSPADQIAVALTLALSKHIPTWEGCTDEQMEALAEQVCEAIGFGAISDRLETSEEFLGDAQAQIKELQRRLSEAEQERDKAEALLDEACNETHCCDDIPLNLTLAGRIAALRESRDKAEAERDAIARRHEKALVAGAELRRLLVERDGGSHDQDCKALSARYGGVGVSCNCGHDEVMEYLYPKIEVTTALDIVSEPK